jgi:branched-chain amino acid aminotransferase
LRRLKVTRSIPDQGSLSEAVVYVNGEFVPEHRAAVSVFDHGFLYGDGVYDTSCAWGGAVFMLEEHLDRLYRSIHATKLDFRLSREELRGLILETVRRNGLQYAYIKVVVTRGVSAEPLLDPRHCRASLIIFARRYLSLVDGDKATHGITTKTSSLRRVPHEALDPKIKSLNYLNLVLAKIEAIDSGCDDAIVLDTSGYVCEGPGYNIFAVRQGTLLTPAEAVLLGITRMAVCEIAARMGVKVSEGSYTPYDFYIADEAFFCSTAGGIIPITHIDGRVVGSGEPGPLTLEIRRAYLEMLESGVRSTPVYVATPV